MRTTKWYLTETTMLLNLKTIHKPDTLPEAIALLQQPGTYPLYGGAALQRSADPNVTAGIDLCKLELDYVRDTENSLRLGSMLTLEQARLACLERGDENPKLAGLAMVLKEEMPEVQRHTFTLGDLLMERNPQSPALTALLAMGGIIKRIDLEMRFTMAAWLLMRQEYHRWLLAQVRVTRGGKRCGVAYEKVARTPADAPIVGAVAYVKLEDDGDHFQARLALTGAAPTPLPQPRATRQWESSGDLDAALDALELDPPDDHWGSREYRTEMARVVARRALQRARELAESQ
jgi:carbon-monoxide dehydrogenase medium subunit